jgi:hypothetical protein
LSIQCNAVGDDLQMQDQAHGLISNGRGTLERCRFHLHLIM